MLTDRAEIGEQEILAENAEILEEEAFDEKDGSKGRRHRIYIRFFAIGQKYNVSCAYKVHSRASAVHHLT